ncbi:hypothetical protein B0H19DRAFT_1062121 [Mycena capillaripes]|nr:hypothetical protein B0H19DRAFT_1062121 [Mycena capillaripes]
MPIQATDKHSRREISSRGTDTCSSTPPWGPTGSLGVRLTEDCCAIYDKVQKAFKGAEGSTLTIVQVRLENELSRWKSQDNIFRASPWNVDGLPTLYHVDKGNVEHRYEEDPDIIRKLDEIIVV